MVGLLLSVRTSVYSVACRVSLDVLLAVCQSLLVVQLFVVSSSGRQYVIGCRQCLRPSQ